MIAVDTSAFVAIIADEPDGRAFERALREADGIVMSAVSLFECRTVVLRKHGELKLDTLLTILDTLAVTIVPFDAAQAVIAFDAYRRFGKGSGHGAALNLGDCAAYALAVSRGLPLLYKGEDFRRTDVRSALA
mgnify:CR=1 FL=1